MSLGLVKNPQQDPEYLFQNELVLRLETDRGVYANAAGENSGVFDVIAVAGVVNGYPSEYLIEDQGVKGILTERGTVLVCQREYRYNVDGVPGDPSISIEQGSEGIRLENPLGIHEPGFAPDELVHDLLHSGKTVTLLGTSAVESVLRELDNTPTLYSKQVGAIIAIASNYATRRVPH